MVSHCSVLLLIFITCNARTYREDSGCSIKSDPGPSCSSWCDALWNGNCSPLPEEKCDVCNGQSCHERKEDGNCSPLPNDQCVKRCECDCEPICHLEYIQNTGSCNIGKLGQVDKEIAQRISWTVGQAAIGSVPYVGSVLSTVMDIFAITGVIPSPTNEWDLANQIRAAVDSAIAELESCMDEKFADAVINRNNDDIRASYKYYQMAAVANGTKKTERIEYTWLNFEGNIEKIFGEENNYLEYTGMLPLFESYSAMYASIACEYLMTLWRARDKTNLINDMTIIEGSFNDLLQWIDWARDSIAANLRAEMYKMYPAVQNGSIRCLNYEESDKELKDWESDFSNRYRLPVEENKLNVTNFVCAIQGQSCDTTYALCKVVGGNAQCVCQTGWTGDGTTCDNVNECDTEQDNCHPEYGVCTDIEGSFDCSCKSNYTGNGRTCDYVDGGTHLYTYGILTYFVTHLLLCI